MFIAALNTVTAKALLGFTICDGTRLTGDFLLPCEYVGIPLPERGEADPVHFG
jgi:hypothetical protein